MSHTNEEITHEVRRRLADDPRLPRDDEIAVETNEGVVTLRGTVGSFAQDGSVTLTGAADRMFQSDRAFDHMTSLRGVTGVTNQIKVAQAL